MSDAFCGASASPPGVRRTSIFAKGKNLDTGGALPRRGDQIKGPPQGLPCGVIGITGGSGAGKSTALEVLADMGAVILDCDVVYHELAEADGSMLDELAERFPGVVMDGRLLRKALGQIVFHDPAALADLNAITHNYVCREIDTRLAALAARGVSLIAIEAIALIESGLSQRCDVVVGIIAPVADRLRRITAREGIDPAYAAARIESQQSDAFFRAHCDFILENAYVSQADFAAACRVLFGRVL